MAIVIILAGVHLALALATAVLRGWLRPDDPRRPPERRAEVRTLVPLVESLLRYLFYFTALVMILDRLHFHVAALLTSAGIVGIAIGFGAQPLIRDVIAGFFLLFEGLVQVGDVIRLGDATGEVERVNLRTTQIRTYSGELVTIPNGQIQQFGNQNRGFMRAIVQIGVAYEADIERAMALMQHLGQEWAGAHPDQVLAPPQVHGILAFGASDVSVRLVAMVKPAAYNQAERELRLRLKAAFDTEGIGMSSPSRVITLPGALEPGTSEPSGAPSAEAKGG